MKHTAVAPDAEMCQGAPSMADVVAACPGRRRSPLPDALIHEVRYRAIVLGHKHEAIGFGEPPASAVAGIQAIVKEIRKKSDHTKILLLGVFPRAEKPDHPFRGMVKEINAAAAKLDDEGKSVKFLDIGGKFLQADGSISKEVMPDFLHLSEKGYQIWADAIKDTLVEMLK